MKPFSIAENLTEIRKKIAFSCQKANRLPQAVTLVAVSKFHPLSAVEEAIAAGQKVFGENRIQEAHEKFSILRPRFPDLRLHLTGPIQTNKALAACEIADVIETLDRTSLCDALRKSSQKAGKLPDLFIQINSGDEPQKAGVSPKEADRFIEQAQNLFGEKIIGLMCLPPHSKPALPYFEQLAAMAKKHGLKELSMGMSADFEIGIEAGATFVRIGTAIFGARPA